MKSVSVVKSGIVCGVVTLLCLGACRAAPAGKQLLELRKYSFATSEKKAAFEQYLEKAAIPALNRAGVKPVGAFKMLAADNEKLKWDRDPLELYVLLPHDSCDSLLALPGKLDGDSAHAEAGKGVLDTAKKDPAYKRVETSLFLAFDGIAKVEVPTTAEDRILQLRIYESHNADRALRKMEMFTQGGELPLFRKVGLDPVFFGQAMAGTLMPNLTYMLSFENDEARKEAWAKFLAHPEWKTMKSDPTYKDTVSRITNQFLRPIAASQI